LAFFKEDTISEFISRLFLTDSIPDEVAEPDFATLSEVEFDAYVIDGLLAYCLSSDSCVAEKAINLLKKKILSAEKDEHTCVIHIFTKMQVLCSNRKVPGCEISFSIRLRYS
jgi:hypothetical protein